MKRFYTLLLLFACIVFPVHAQSIEVNPKFGAVSEAEIDMLVYPPDTTASILLLYGSKEIRMEISNRGGFEQVIIVHHRWKVLKEAGKREIDYELFRKVRTSNDDRIYDIKATTFNRENGQVQQQKMSKKFIFDEKYTEGVNRVSFAPENVKVGSVVEVGYTFRTASVDIGRLYFQADYPINRMDVSATYPEYLTYSRLQLGGGDVDFSKETSIANVNIGGDVLSYNVTTDHYRTVDMPALREEAFSYCPRHYRSSINYELMSFYIPGVVNENYNSSWEKVDQMISQSNLLKYCKTKMKDIESLRTRIDGVGSEAEKIALVRNEMVSKVKWDKGIELIPKDGKSLMKDGKGDSADLNALVASALNTLGYRAEPVLVKFRTNGPMVDYQISTDQFDAFILKITCPNGEEHYLDAVRDDAWVDILDPNYLVSKARLIDLDGNGSWIDLTEVLPKNSISESVLFNFKEDGTWGGSVRIKATGADSYKIRRRYHSFDEAEEWIEDTEEDEGVSIASMKLEDPEGYHPESMIQYEFETDQHLGDEYLYLNVILTKFHSETAFQSEKRQLPVEFPYCHSVSYRCSFMVPAGYEIESVPQSEHIVCSALDGKAMSASLQCIRQGNQFALSYRFTVDAMILAQNLYPDLRSYWEHLCRIEKATIVLKKKP